MRLGQPGVAPGPTRVQRTAGRVDRRMDLCELDDLPGAEAQLLVVVQHRVHVLNPDGVHWPIEHVPLLAGVGGDGPHPDEGGEDPICPAATREEGPQAQLAPRETWIQVGPALRFFFFVFSTFIHLKITVGKIGLFGIICNENVWLYSLPAVLCLLIQSCLTLCNPIDCSPPGSSVHGAPNAREAGG